MRIAICDDEKSCLDAAISAADSYNSLHPDKKLIFDTFSHPEDVIEASEKIGGYDIYVLDIIMPNMNGIELGKKLRETGYDGNIIYLTSSEEYSLDAFQVKAYDYLIKPIKPDVFEKTLNEVLELISEKKDKHIIVKSKEKSVKISFDSICYAELNKRAVRYYLIKGKTIDSVTLRTNFAEALKELTDDSRFCLCSQSIVVNLDHITEVENEAVVFGDTYKAFLGEKTCRKLRSIWSSHLFSQEG